MTTRCPFGDRHRMAFDDDTAPPVARSWPDDSEAAAPDGPTWPTALAIAAKRLAQGVLFGADAGERAS